MENEKEQNEGFGYYMKRYGGYLIFAGVVFVLLVAIVVTALVSSSKNVAEPVNSPTVIKFQSPIANGQVAMGYSDTELQYNKTLNVWQVHKGVDYVAEIGQDVCCAYDGTVASISTDILHGTVVEIEHGNGLKTSYGSLDANILVKVGDVVKAGEVIGKASNTATAETVDSGEVHFEVWKDGNLVDPASYLDLTTGK